MTTFAAEAHDDERWESYWQRVSRLLLASAENNFTESREKDLIVEGRSGRETG